MKLSIAIQHHPDRAELLGPLMAALTPAHVLVARDPTPTEKPNALRTYLSALRLAPASCSHHLILQDDVTLCRNFVAGAKLALVARPDEPVSFFCSSQPLEAAHRIRCAQDRGETFALLEPRRWTPAVALAWPVALAGEFVEFVEGQGWPSGFGADDEAIGRFLRGRGVSAWATVPSLVEHPDATPSLIGRRMRKGRCAAYYIGDGDPLAILWR